MRLFLPMGVYILVAGLPLQIKVEEPDGYALLWFLLLVIVLAAVFFTIRFLKRTKTPNNKRAPLFVRKKIEIVIEKDRLYYPDSLKLVIKNTGNVDLDIDRPLLIFSRVLAKRKFRLKGSNNYSFYPLFLEKGKIHDITIDLNQFYMHDRRLKRYPRVTIMLSEVNKPTLARKSVMLRKTLFR